MTETPSQIASPLVKWVGGKRQLQEPILEMIHSVFDKSAGTYFEPFFGGGAILFALAPREAVVSDLNEGLVNLYLQVRDNLHEVTASLSKFEEDYNAIPEHKKSDFYYETREMFNLRGASGGFDNRLGPEGAARFLFLNKTGFNGMYRENARGELNIPFGKRSSITLFEDQNIRQVSEALRGAKIHSQSYERTVEEAVQGDFVYFDPPYAPLTKTSSFEGYNSANLGGFDQVGLRDLFVGLTEKGVHCLVSNSSADQISDLYSVFRITGVSANRAISAGVAGRKKVKEFLIDNFDQV